MSSPKPSDLKLFNSEDLAVHIVDTLVDHGLVEDSKFQNAVASVKWELDAQAGMKRVILRVEKPK